MVLCWAHALARCWCWGLACGSSQGRSSSSGSVGGGRGCCYADCCLLLVWLGAWFGSQWTELCVFGGACQIWQCFVNCFHLFAKACSMSNCVRLGIGLALLDECNKCSLVSCAIEARVIAKLGGKAKHRSNTQSCDTQHWPENTQKLNNRQQQHSTAKYVQASACGMQCAQQSNWCAGHMQPPQLDDTVVSC